MSRKERDRLKVLARAAEGRLRQVEAARLMKLSVRHARRLQKRYEAEGDKGLVHRSRGRPSNRRIPAARRREVLQRVRADYADFGPTLAAEKLAQRDGLAVSRETLRQWMVEDGLWKVRRPAREVHLWRPRRSCAGELVQMDTSEHHWFEGRGDAEPVLITVIDDATNKTESRFFEGDTTKANLEVIGRYVRRYGVPLATYADRKSLFKALRPPTTEEALAGREPESQVARALTGTGDAVHPGRVAAGQGPGGTVVPDGPGPPGQGTAAGGDLDNSGGQPVPGRGVSSGAEPPVLGAAGLLGRCPSVGGGPRPGRDPERADVPDGGERLHGAARGPAVSDRASVDPAGPARLQGLDRRAAGWVDEVAVAEHTKRNQ